MKPRSMQNKNNSRNEETIADVMQEATARAAATFVEISTDLLNPSPTNPRKLFREEALQELANSIVRDGQLQPINVRPTGDTYEIVAGERRYRACILAGIPNMMCRVDNLTDEQVLDIQIAENLHRENVTAMEEADSFYSLTQLKKKRLTVAEIAVRIGKSERYVYERMSLRDLIPEAQEYIDTDIINLKHGLFLARFPFDIQRRTLDHIVKKQWDGVILGVAPLAVAKQFVTSIMLDLNLAKWDKKEKNMCGDLPSCAQCVLRTGANTTLFNDIAEIDYCLNADCFDKKKTETYVRLQKKLKDESTAPVVFISDGYHYDNEKPNGLFNANILEDEDEDDQPEDKTKAVFDRDNYQSVETARTNFYKRFGEDTEFPEALVRKAVVVDGKEEGSTTEVVLYSEMNEFINSKVLDMSSVDNNDDEDDNDEDEETQVYTHRLSYTEEVDLRARLLPVIVDSFNALAAFPFIKEFKTSVIDDFGYLDYNTQELLCKKLLLLDENSFDEFESYFEKYINDTEFSVAEIQDVMLTVIFLKNIESNVEQFEAILQTMGVEIPAKAEETNDDVNIF